MKFYTIFAKPSVLLMKNIRGKIVTQGQHACLHAIWDAEKRFPHFVEAYKNSERAFKINLIVPSVDDLIKLRDTYQSITGCSLVTDAGFTVFDEPTTTCLGIGPIPLDLIGDDLKSLKLFS